jgi:hypothetical protein
LKQLQYAVGVEKVMPLPDWVDWTNTGVGVGGLLLTLGALFQAKGAKEAANKAEKSVQSHHAETDFAVLMRMAKELHGYIESGQLAEARVRTTDLRTELSTALERHKKFLKDNWKPLKEQQYSLTLAANLLNRRAEELSAKERTSLLESTGAILEVLAGQCGELGSTVERSTSYE